MNHPAKGVRAAALALALAVWAAPASATVIGFDGMPQYFTSGTYSEGGYTFTHLSGTTWGNEAGELGNPGEEFWVGYFDAPTVGDTVILTRDGGGLFTFDSIDLASQGEFQSDQVDFIGRVGGIQTESSGPASSNLLAYATYAPGFGAAVDELLFVVAGVGSASLKFDNVTLTEVGASVPVPAPLALLAGGIGALSLLRRRRREA